MEEDDFLFRALGKDSGIDHDMSDFMAESPKHERGGDGRSDRLSNGPEETQQAMNDIVRIQLNH